jgi:hypothetical protein
MKFYITGAALSLLVGLTPLLIAISSDAEASRESCECRELRAIRQILEHQFGVVCNESRCLPAPTPTAPNGGELP